MSAVADPPLNETHDPPPAPEPVPADAKPSKPTEYVVVTIVHQPETTAGAEVSALRDLGFTEYGVPFVVGGHENPKLFASTSSGPGAKQACLKDHPELAACIREPGLSLATWPARSYGFKRVEFEPQPDKLKV